MAMNKYDSNRHVACITCRYYEGETQKDNCGFRIAESSSYGRCSLKNRSVKVVDSCNQHKF